jgi:DNA-binding transcriptional regulator YiaG
VNRKYQSEQLMVIHESAQTLYKIGVIDGSKMKEFDEACLVGEPEATEERSLARRSRRRGVYVKPY